MSVATRLTWSACKRGFCTTPARQSYPGATPVPLPPSISLSRTESSLLIKGPLGSTTIPVEPYMKFILPSAPSPDAQAEQKKKIKRNMSCPPTATDEPFSLTVPNSSKEGVPPMELSMFVTDPTKKTQRMMWGTTRTLIANAVTGQTTGFILPVYLLGVGFRAALEPDPRRLPANHKDVIAAGGPDVPRTRLAMKLGYSHTLYLVVPQGIKVTVPSPTIINVFGTDKAKVGQFAADIRKERKPEPYKGKVCLVLPSCCCFWTSIDASYTGCVCGC